MILDPQCPFCAPSEDDKVILETNYGRVLCDARPVMIGHVLVTPKTHTASVFDLDQPTYAHLRILQQEVARRLYTLKGQVGVYEHGRSMLCRFHEVNRGGYCHAHLHVLPASFDLIGTSGYESTWESRPSKDVLTGTDRYLYQDQGAAPHELWAVGALPVRRHFVRAAFQDLLAEQGESWLPLEASPDDHDDAVEATAALLMTLTPAPTANVLVLDSLIDGIRNQVAETLGLRLDCKVIDSEILYRFAAWKDAHQDALGNASTLLENFANGSAVLVREAQNGQTGIKYKERHLYRELFDHDVETRLQEIVHRDRTSAEIMQLINFLRGDRPAIVLDHFTVSPDEFAFRVVLTSPSDNEIESAVGSNVSNRSIGRWDALRVEIQNLSSQDIAEIILEGWRLRFGSEM